jgi:hypothetical protein
LSNLGKDPDQILTQKQQHSDDGKLRPQKNNRKKS